MIKVGIESGAYLGRYGFAEGLKKMVAHGYEALDYQDFCNTETPLFQCSEAEFEKRLKEERKQIEDAGLVISQTHGPWRWPPQDFTEEQRAERFEKMAKSIRGNAILGCENFVIHPIMPFGDNQDPEPEKLWSMNYEFMGRLTEVAKEYGVVICFENMPMRALSLSRPSEILKFVKNINSDHFKMCLDTGHCAVFGESPAEAVRLIGKDILRVLHIHDNNGQGDLHWIPYTGVIDWTDFAAALQEIGFEGAASLECAVPGKIPADIRDLAELSLCRMAYKIAGRI